MKTIGLIGMLVGLPDATVPTSDTPGLHALVAGAIAVGESRLP